MIQLNGQALAYIGDAVFELQIREYLLGNQLTKVNDLHKEAIKYTSAVSQAKMIDYILASLSEEETDIYKRGRNAKETHKPKNASLNEYRKATGFESLLGYLYLNKNDSRLMEIIKKSIDYINEENGRI